MQITTLFSRLCLVACLCLLGIVHAAHADAFTEGLQSYEAKAYSAAIQHFETALDTQPETAALRHNLALAYFQTGNSAEALWQLERAHRLAPTDSAIIVKTQLLKQQIGLFSSPPKWFTIAPKLLNFQQWLILVTVTFWLLVLSYLLLRKGPIWLTVLRTALWIGLLGSLPLAWFSHQDLSTGIILGDQPIQLRAAPASAAPAIANQLPGSTARIIDSHESFYKIKTPENNEGWLPKEAFRLVYIQ